jgi:hypothetical protein
MDGPTVARSASLSSTGKRSRARRRPSFLDSDPDDEDDSPHRPSTPTRPQSYSDRLNSLLGTTSPTPADEPTWEQAEADFGSDRVDGVALVERQSWLDEDEIEDDKLSVRAYEDTFRQLVGLDGEGAMEADEPFDRGDDELDPSSRQQRRQAVRPRSLSVTHITARLAFIR